MNKLLLFTALLVCWSFYSSQAQLSMKKNGDGILITENGEGVLQYHTKPKKQNAKYEACNYIHPLYSLKGSVLTEDSPSDHPHHRGIFWAWHQLWIGEQKIGDSWDLLNFKQTVDEVEFIKHANGSALLKTNVSWFSDNWKKAGREIPFLNENTKITVWPRLGKYRKIDFEIHLLALEDGLKLGGAENEKAYGGFSVRMLLSEDVQFYGREGEIQAKETPVQSKDFINITGSVEVGKKPGGIVIVDHPENPGYPQSWILRSKNSMQNAVWPGKEAIGISTSEALVLRYSIIVYSGKMNAKKIGKITRNQQVIK